MNKTTPTSTIEVLKAARELISVPERWTQYVSARTANGAASSTDDPEATCWCAWGAVHHLYGEDVADTAVDALIVANGGDPMVDGIADFNDNHTHADVLALFDRAIANLESGSK